MVLEADSPCCHRADGGKASTSTHCAHQHTSPRVSYDRFRCLGVNVKRMLGDGANSLFDTAVQSARGRQTSGEARSRGRRTGGESICHPSFQPPHPSPALLLPSPACTRVRGQLLAPFPLLTHLASALAADLCSRVCLYKGIQKCVYVHQILDGYINLFKRAVPSWNYRNLREICSSSSTVTRAFIH